MDGFSQDIMADKLAQLKQILPEAFTEDKIDIDKLKQTLGDSINTSTERYNLNWAGKSNAYKSIQTRTTKTLSPCVDESIDFAKTNNLFIEGENLEVLKILQHSYYGKIKMIYIDPPYNTGNDFIYHDNYRQNKQEYQREIGDIDDDGNLTMSNAYQKNSKENGHYHSNWLSMMMPRLYLARNLLKDDGVIFISIDDNEVHNLRLLCNEIFGEENFITPLIWNSSNNIMKGTKHIRKDHEYILVYAKNINTLDKFKMLNNNLKFINPDHDPNGEWLNTNATYTNGGYEFEIITPSGCSITRKWRFSKEQYINGEIALYFNGSNVPRLKIYKKDYDINNKSASSLLSNEVAPTITVAKNEITSLLDKVLFETPKPIQMILYLIKLATNNNDIILDFFAGSGTTAHAVMALNREDGGNRRYICVQLPEACDELSEAYKNGYKTIADITKERIKKASNKIALEIQHDIHLADIDLGCKMFRLQNSNFKQWQFDNTQNLEDLEAQLEMMIDPCINDAKLENIVYEMMLKHGYSLTSMVEYHANYTIVRDNSTNGNITLPLVILANSVSLDIISQIVEQKPNKVLILDRVFGNNDVLKTNFCLNLTQSNIKFEVV
jgi:adenine-specific DNA-methyltransferase